MIEYSAECYPLTIVMDRYTGTYSGGKFLAFNLDFDEIPEEVNGGDVTCANFFYSTDIVYGRGDTPNEAYEDLQRRLSEVSNAEQFKK